MQHVLSTGGGTAAARLGGIRASRYSALRCYPDAPRVMAETMCNQSAPAGPSAFINR
jgi:hypothetical protein